MIYILVALSLLALSYVTLGAPRMRLRLYWPVFTFLFLFASFRYQVGCDWSGYYGQYESSKLVARDLIANLSEPIWWIIMAWLKGQKLYYPLINVIAGAIFFAGVHLLARRQPDRLAFLVMLFPVLIINLPMSGIRQGAAIGVMCFAYAAFIDRRPLRYALLVVLAGGFHTSALVFMILAPISTGNYSRNRLLIAGLLAVPGLLFLAQTSGGLLATTRYIDTDKDAAGAIFRVGAIALTGLYFRFFLRRKWEQDFPKDLPLASIGSLGMLAAFVLVPLSSVIADRFAYYFIPIQAMMFARLPYFTFARYKWQHVALPYVALAVMFVGWSQASSLFDGCYMPYRTWLFGAPAGDILKGGASL